MRFHVLGIVSLNGGDAAILEAQVAIFQRQYPGAVVTASDRDADAAARYFPGVEFSPFLSARFGAHRGGGRRSRLRQAVRRRRLQIAAGLMGRGRVVGPFATAAERRALGILRGADVLAYTGGTTLTENYDFYEKLFDLDLARRLGRPLVFMQQSAGPFTDPENRRELGRIFPAADLVLLRDERSLGYVIDVGASPDRCRVLPDTVFALAPDELPPSPSNVRPRVAVSLRRWWKFHGLTEQEGMARYLGSVRAAVTRLVRERDADVVFVSTCQGRPEYWADDSAVAVDAVAELPADVAARMSVDRSARTAAELIGFLSGFDAMVSTRLHGGILAACAGVPTLAIAYEFKTQEVWGQLGLSDWAIDIEDLRPESLGDRVLALVDERVQVRAVLAAELPAQREGALSAGQEIAAMLTARPR